MGHPQRAESWNDSAVDDGAAAQDEYLVEVAISEWFADDADDTGPWCVDHGVSMDVMSTRDIYGAVECGRLSPDTKVWRDGRACWLPIAECHELTVEPDPTPTSPSVPTRSGIRRVRRTAAAILRDEEAPSEARSNAALILSALIVGALAAALVVVPFDDYPSPRPLQPAAGHIALDARVIAARAREAATHGGSLVSDGELVSRASR